MQILVNVGLELLRSAQVGLAFQMLSDKLSVTEQSAKLKCEPVWQNS